jgi:hypothetical protein
MIKKFKNLAMSLILMMGFSAPVLAPVAVYAQATNCDGIQECLDAGADATDPEHADDQSQGRALEIIQDVINIFSLIVGVVSVIMIIIGGLKYITSGGDSGNVTGAKNTILYAVIGLVVVALSQFIVHFVLGRVLEG